jgi:hypothetical protein
MKKWFHFLIAALLCACSNSESNYGEVDDLPVKDDVVPDTLIADTLKTDSLEEKDSLPEDTIPVGVKEDSLKDMWHVHASGSVVTLGTD